MYCDCDVFMIYKLTIFTVNIKRKNIFCIYKKNTLTLCKIYHEQVYL